MADKKNSETGKIQLKHTKRGVLYADPQQILRSSNAKKQIKALKRSSIWKKLQPSSKI